MSRFNKKKVDYGSFEKQFGNRRFSSASFQQREMHKAVCGDCGKECDVPFKPAEGRPVYCRECYPKHKKF